MSKVNTSQAVQFTPVHVGDMSEIPPDLPAGGWEAQCTVKLGATNKDKYPMLLLEWKTTRALDDANDSKVGGGATDFLVFFPEGHKAIKMSRVKLKQLCDALDIQIPAVADLKSWGQIEDFLDELNGAKGTIYTTVQLDKLTGEPRTQIGYVQPGASKAAADDDAEEDKPKKNGNGKKARR